MGYWGEVRKRAVRSALKAASLDTSVGVVKLFLTLAATAATGIFASGLSGDVWLKVGLTLAVPMAIALFFLAVEFVALPPRIHEEQKGEIVRLQAAVASANEPPDMVKIKGLIQRHLDRCWEVRKVQPRDLQKLSAYAREAVSDLKAIFGREFGEGYEKMLHAGLDQQALESDRLRSFKDFEMNLEAQRPTFTSDHISRETPDINAYVTARLAALRLPT